MTTDAAILNEQEGNQEKADATPGSTDAPSSTTNNPPTTPTNMAQNMFGKLSLGFGSAEKAMSNTGRAIGNFLPTASLQAMTQPRYTLPDKNVASQVLMYRQLLHTKCRPGLRLSRPYQATPAQKAVLHMPWWEQGIEESKKMVISYDNLIVRLWMNGGIMPFADLLGGDVDTMLSEDGLPPIPHQYWVDRLGFQQPDPVTDFRSGGVLSLAMMVHMVESCLPTVQRFIDGDAKVLPFGITSINITDMMSKFLMLTKSVDRMEALVSQKPFWRMFSDPNAILACHEIAMNMLADVVVEMNRERKLPNKNKTPTKKKETMPGGGEMDEFKPVSVFDFSEVLERTEKRVSSDLLGAGPKTVDELRSISERLRLKYQYLIETKEKYSGVEPTSPPHLGKIAEKTVASAGSAVASAGSAVAGAGSLAVGVFEKLKSSTKLPAPPSFSNPLAPKAAAAAAAAPPEPTPTIVALPPVSTPDTKTTLAPEPAGDDDDWTGVSKDDVPAEATNPTDDIADLLGLTSPAVSQFSIGDDSDDDL